MGLNGKKIPFNVAILALFAGAAEFR